MKKQQGTSHTITVVHFDKPDTRASSGAAAAASEKPKPSGSRRKTTTLEQPVSASDVVTELEVIPEEQITEPAPAPVPAKKAGKPSRPRTVKKKDPRGLSRAKLAELSKVGHKLFKQKRYEEVKKLFGALVAAKVKDPFPYTMLGTVYLAQKQPHQALGFFESALGVDPRDVPALVYRGEIRLKQGQLRGAVEDLARAVREGDSENPFVVRAKRLLKVARDAHRAKS
jgi:hypothetical protein